MRKILSVISLICICTVLCGCGAEKAPQNLLEKIIKNDKIVIGVKSDAKPFGFKDENGELKGYDIDLAKKITKKLLGDENKIEFVEVTPSNRIITLTSGKVDMVIATMSITHQRQIVIDFSTPYYIAGQALMTPKNSDIHGITDLKDKKVIVILGTTGEKNIKRIAPDSIIQGYKTYTEAYKALKDGKGDALTTDDSILAGIVLDDPSMKILAKRYTQEPYAVAFRAEPESKTLKSAVNHIIEHMQSTGELNRLKNKWIKF